MIVIADRNVRSASGGSALIVVLWTVGLLSMFVGSFAFDAHVESRLTSYYRKRTKAQHLALSGVEFAKLIMAKSSTINPKAPAEDVPEDDEWYEPARSLAEGNTLRKVIKAGDGEIDIHIVTEQARRNVNLLTDEEEWEPILEVGDVPEDLWPELIESFLDWTDKDEESRADGGETEDYYSALDPAYGARDGPLYTVQELKMIKGFTAAIVDGGVLDPEAKEPVIISGIGDLLTVFGGKKININAASRRVLMTLPNTDNTADLIAGAVLEERQGIPDEDGESEPAYFEDDGDLFRRIPELAVAPLKNYVTTAASKFFRITCVGRVSAVEKKVWCIAEVKNEELVFLRWREDD